MRDEGVDVVVEEELRSFRIRVGNRQCSFTLRFILSDSPSSPQQCPEGYASVR